MLMLLVVSEVARTTKVFENLIFVNIREPRVFQCLSRMCQLMSISS